MPLIESSRNQLKNRGTAPDKNGQLEYEPKFYVNPGLVHLLG